MIDTLISVGANLYKRFRAMGDGTNAEVVANVPLTRDSTRAYSFNPDELPSVTYMNADGSPDYTVLGPDENGNSFKKTYTYYSDRIVSSGWVKLL